MDHVSSATELCAASAMSTHVDAVMATEQACDDVQAGLMGGRADLVMLFVSGEHAQHAVAIAKTMKQALDPGTYIVVTAESLVGGASELERKTGLAMFAASMPGTTLHPFTYRQIPHVASGEEDTEGLIRVAEAIGARKDLRGVFFFADPFSIPAASAVQTIGAARMVIPGLERIPVIGGMASAGAAPGQNILIMNDEVFRAGGVGVTIRGNVAIDTLVSQGCRPIGRPMVVTAGQRNVIKTLSGQSAMDALRDTINGLSEEDRELLPKGVFIGRVINEYKERFGRGDFLIRGVMGADENSGAIAVADAVRVGQTVQFHLRDATTASEDLKLLLDIQGLGDPPVGGLLFTCNGRGRRLFDVANHDAATISAAFALPGGGDFPLAGFFAAGEIGPIGDSSFVHGHTASLALFRPGSRGHSVG